MSAKLAERCDAFITRRCVEILGLTVRGFMRLTGQRDTNNSFYCHKVECFNFVERRLKRCIVFCGNLFFLTICMQWQSCWQST